MGLYQTTYGAFVGYLRRVCNLDDEPVWHNVAHEGGGPLNARQGNRAEGRRDSEDENNDPCEGDI